MKKSWTRLGCVLVVLAMLLACVPGVFAADETTIYLKPSENWLEGGARFAVYYFTDSESGWVDMTAAGDGFYSAAVPLGSTVILCRMNPNDLENNWNNKWNQTANLSLQSDGKNCFYQPAFLWDGAGNEHWGTLTQAPDVEEPELRYTVAGDAGLCGASWDPAQNPMTETSEGIWEITFTEVPAGTYQFKVTVGTWANSWGASDGGNCVAELTVLSNLTITFNADTKEITTSVEPLAEEEPTAYTVSLHFLPEEGWGSTINAWVWMNENDSVPGFEDYHKSWPGKAIEPNVEHEGWYDLTVTTYNSNGFKFIFNDGSKQTLNLHTGALTGNLDLWYIGNQRYTYAPEEWTGVPVYTYSIYFHNADGWDGVSAYAWTDGGLILGSWPGKEASAVRGNDGWYCVTFTAEWREIYVIFNNNGAGSQTGDLAVAVPEGERNVEVWVEGGAVSYTAPEGWNAVRPGNTVKIHFMPPYVSWGDRIYAWIWNGGGNLPGYEEYHMSWPGKRVEADPDNEGWYYLEVTTELSDFNFIFSGIGQTRDLYIDNITGDMEIWVFGNAIYDEKPAVSPATGDNANLALYVGLMTVSILAMGATVLMAKKKSV